MASCQAATRCAPAPPYDEPMTIPKSLANLKIILYPNPVLKKVCAEVDVFDDALAGLAQRLCELMHNAEGVGLAAPQVGIPLQLFVCNTTGEPDADHIYVNPRFTGLSGAEEVQEGCLSIPDVSVTMRRSTHATMEARLANGEAISVIGADLRARVWQHEIDHLNGKLITDHMSAADEIANRRALKLLKQEYAANRDTGRRL